MQIRDHNQILRPFSFKHYQRRLAQDVVVCHCWFSRQHMFDDMAGCKSHTVAVYHSVEFDAYLLTSNAIALSAKHPMNAPADLTFDLDAPPVGHFSYADTQYQGLGTFYASIPLVLVVDERLAGVNDMQVNPSYAECNFGEMPAGVIEELQRHRLY